MVYLHNYLMARVPMGILQLLLINNHIYIHQTNSNNMEWVLWVTHRLNHQHQAELSIQVVFRIFIMSLQAMATQEEAISSVNIRIRHTLQVIMGEL